eukprot:CAMPEP_0178984898 /NCGR_PEP_ID=MMETSP0795-20121207/1864_1 /TAXON_ID=88552 /ORGANISM="Amoebophrya sp., Strain Ameob2" /LENGTH=415 /DNA_ID=CAMNT_0020675819 /DNA_START=109 /DNA_END=1356 /DNA_ORIENTATION=+
MASAVCTGAVGECCSGSGACASDAPERVTCARAKRSFRHPVRPARSNGSGRPREKHILQYSGAELQALGWRGSATYASRSQERPAPYLSDLDSSSEFSYDDLRDIPADLLPATWSDSEEDDLDGDRRRTATGPDTGGKEGAGGQGRTRRSSAQEKETPGPHWAKVNGAACKIASVEELQDAIRGAGETAEIVLPARKFVGLLTIDASTYRTRKILLKGAGDARNEAAEKIVAQDGVLVRRPRGVARTHIALTNCRLEKFRHAPEQNCLHVEECVCSCQILNCTIRGGADCVGVGEPEDRAQRLRCCSDDDEDGCMAVQSSLVEGAADRGIYCAQRRLLLRDTVVRNCGGYGVKCEGECHVAGACHIQEGPWDTWGPVREVMDFVAERRDDIPFATAQHFHAEAARVEAQEKFEGS